MTKAEKAVVRAAMRYYRWLGCPPSLSERHYENATAKLVASCARLAASRRKKK